MYMYMKRSDGNALFLILIAVALFAALSYAITQSGRGSTGIDREKASIAAARIEQYATQMQQKIQRLTTLNHCTDNQISFNNDSDGDGNYVDADDDNNNPNSPADGSCHMFHTNGGNLAPFKMDGLIDTSQSAARYYGMAPAIGLLCIDGVGSGSADCQNDPPSVAELILFFPYVTKEICEALNTNIISSIPKEANDFYHTSNAWFNGTFDTYSRLQIPGGVNNGVYSMCIQSANSGTNPPPNTYHFYFVLKGR